MKAEFAMANSIFEVMRKHNLSPGDSMVVLSMVAALVIANSGNKWDAAGIEAFAETVRTTIELLEEMQDGEDQSATAGGPGSRRSDS